MEASSGVGMVAAWMSRCHGWSGVLSWSHSAIVTSYHRGLCGSLGGRGGLDKHARSTSYWLCHQPQLRVNAFVPGRRNIHDGSYGHVVSTSIGAV